MIQKILLLILFVAISGSSVAELKKEKRCGWLINPTPANWYLTDATGDLWISGQGGPAYIPDEDWDNLPQTNESEYVKTNVHYGYSCMCLNVSVDKKNKSNRSNRIIRIYGGEALPLKHCRADKKLPKQQ